MKKLLILISLLLFLIMPSSLFAQSMMGRSVQPSANDHTAQEETEGKDIWEKLQLRQLDCKNLTDDNFDTLGEYVMGQSIGNTQRHAFMNQMMTNMMGEEGEKQMHITLGKRYSGCDTTAPFPQNNLGFMPMTWMMGGGGNPMMGYGGLNNWNNMMGWGGFGFGWIFMIIFWILIILGIVALVRYLRGIKQNDTDKTPMDILKERYAKGEINKKEFEEMKKDLR